MNKSFLYHVHIQFPCPEGLGGGLFSPNKMYKALAEGIWSPGHKIYMRSSIDTISWLLSEYICNCIILNIHSKRDHSGGISNMIQKQSLINLRRNCSICEWVEERVQKIEFWDMIELYRQLSGKRTTPSIFLLLFVPPSPPRPHSLPSNRYLYLEVSLPLYPNPRLIWKF